MKRFTETKKWSDAWYRKLSPRLKCLWQHLLDHCDPSGVIDPDWELISFQVGESVNSDDLQSFQDRVEILPSGKLWIVKFIQFQYGVLSRECRMHASVFRAIDSNGLTERVSNGYAKGIDTLKDKEQVQDKNKVLVKEEEPPIVNNFPVAGNPATEPEPPPAPAWTPEENPLPATNHGSEPFKAVLRKSEEFCQVWRDWLNHLAALDKPMSNFQKDAVLMECAKKGAERSIEVIRYSILKGAKNPIWDAPRSKATRKQPGSGSPEPDPDGFKRWLSENYPDAEPMPFAECPDSVQYEFKQWKRSNQQQ